MNLLVTGAKGFMGANLCQALLRRNDRLFEIDADTSAADLAGMRFFLYHV